MLLKAKMKIHEHQEKYISMFSLSTLLNNKKRISTLWVQYHFFCMSWLSFSVICQVANILGPEDLLKLLNPIEA